MTKQKEPEIWFARQGVTGIQGSATGMFCGEIDIFVGRPVWTKARPTCKPFWRANGVNGRFVGIAQRGFEITKEGQAPLFGLKPGERLRLESAQRERNAT